MHENRINPRYHTKGHARIPGVTKDDLLLRNLSITGCCLECLELMDKIKPSEIYQIEIKPEMASHIGKFELKAECKWIRNKNHVNEIGFSVTDSPHGKCFQNYVDYIAYNHSEA